MAISSFFGLEIGKRAINAHQTAIQTVGANISNANTEGYSRKEVVFTATEAFQLPSMIRENLNAQMGSGSEVATISRVRDQFLDIQIFGENKEFGRYEKLKDTLHSIELVLNEPSDNTIRTSLDDLWKAFQDLSNEPENISSRNVVVEQAKILASRIGSTANQFKDLRENLNNEVFVKVDEVNTYADELAGVNKQIALISNTGQLPNDLLDKRDLILEKLSKLVNIETTYDIRNTVAVAIKGKPLVEYDRANHLKAVPDAINESFYTVRWENELYDWSSDKDVLSVFANSSALSGNYNFVVNQVAEKHLVTSDSGLLATDINGDLKKYSFDKDTTLYDLNTYLEKKALDPLDPAVIPEDNFFKSGSFKINDIEVNIDIRTDSLETIKNKINQNVEGVSARISVINGQFPQLILESTQTGESSKILFEEFVSESTSTIDGHSNFLSRIGLISDPNNQINGFVTQKAVGDEITGTFHNIQSPVSLNGLETKVFAEFDPALYPEIKNITRGSFLINDKEIYIDPNVDSLDSLVNKINSANAGVTASFIGNNGKLLLESNDKGIDNAIFLEQIRKNEGGSNILEKLQIVSMPKNELVKANNAKLSINSQDIDYESNLLENVIDNTTILINTEKYYEAQNYVDPITGVPSPKDYVGLANVKIEKILDSGELKGLLEARDEKLPEYIDKLDQLAYSLITEINKEHYNGFGLDGGSERVFFENFVSTNSAIKHKDAAINMKISDEISMDVSKIAASGADPKLKSLEGLPISAGAGDGSNMLKIADIRFEEFVGVEKSNINDYFTKLLSTIGSESRQAKNMHETKSLLIERLDIQREAISGVSLDEEFSKLIQFQQGYNRAAKFVKAIQEMLDTIINL